MAKLKGITVILINKVETEKDGFNHPIYEEEQIKVENVLVSPVSTAEQVEMLNLTGKKAVYSLAIPKGDTHVWKNQKVSFFGTTWQVIGFPQRGIDENIPLDWNEKWMVAQYE